MNSTSYIKNIQDICKKIETEKEYDLIQDYVLQLYQFLQQLKTKNVELDQEQLLNIRQLMQVAFTSIVDNGIITKQQLIKPTSILNDIDVVETQFNDEKVASKLFNVGLAALLISCSTMFADVVKNQKNTTKVNTTKMLMNTSASNVAQYAIALLTYLQGKVIGNVYDKAGNIIQKKVHVVYDDCNGTRPSIPWDGKSDLQTFIKKCTGTPTIGYGITDKNIVQKGYLTQKQAISYLYKQILRRLDQNKRIVGKQNIQSLTYIQQACLVALWYNLGNAKATKKCVRYLQLAYQSSNNPQKRNQYLQLAAKQFLDCNKTTVKQGKEYKKVVVPGLTNRVNFLNKVFKQEII